MFGRAFLVSSFVSLSLVSLSHFFFFFTVNLFSVRHTIIMSSPPRVKTTALTHTEEYCFVAIYNPLTDDTWLHRAHSVHFSSCTCQPNLSYSNFCVKIVALVSGRSSWGLSAVCLIRTDFPETLGVTLCYCLKYCNRSLRIWKSCCVHTTSIHCAPRTLRALVQVDFFAQTLAPRVRSRSRFDSEPSQDIEMCWEKHFNDQSSLTHGFFRKLFCLGPRVLEVRANRCCHGLHMWSPHFRIILWHH